MVAGSGSWERQLLFLFVLALPIASIAWTVTHEEVFREPREWCIAKSRTCRRLAPRKFFYLFTCEFCFSHYVTAVFLLITRYKLLFDDWRGYLIGGFSLVCIAKLEVSGESRRLLDRSGVFYGGSAVLNSYPIRGWRAGEGQHNPAVCRLKSQCAARR